MKFSASSVTLLSLFAGQTLALTIPRGVTYDLEDRQNRGGFGGGRGGGRFGAGGNAGGAGANAGGAGGNAGGNAGKTTVRQSLLPKSFVVMLTGYSLRLPPLLQLLLLPRRALLLLPRRHLLLSRQTLLPPTGVKGAKGVRQPIPSV